MTRTLSIAALLVAVVVAAVGIHANRAFYHDDAYISLRYARNLIDGQGLVWNPGERVDGYSNFLFTVLAAGLGAAHVDLVTASRVINSLALAGFLGFLWAQGRALAGRSPLERPLALVPFVLVLASFPLIVWTFGGLEGPLYAALSVAGIWVMRGALGQTRAARPLALSGALLGLACLTRVDGLLFVGVSAVFLVSERGPLRTRVGRFGIFAAAFAAVFVPYCVWRTLYYGTIVPNVFWVKAAGLSWFRLRSGLRYALTTVSVPPFTFALAGGAFVFAALRRSVDRRSLYLAATLVLYGSYVVYVGGDQMPACRLALPLFPVGALLLASLVERTATRAGAPARAAVLAIAVLLSVLQVRDGRVNPRWTNPAAFVGAAVGRYIDSAWPPGALVALNTAGSTPFYAPDLRFIDMLGLNDAHIARREIVRRDLPWQKVPGHLKGDGAYVLSREPDYIIIGPAEGTTADRAWFLSGLEMSEDPRFTTEYSPVEVEIDVSDRPGYQRYGATRTGVMTFTYYRRRGASAGRGGRAAGETGDARRGFHRRGSFRARSESGTTHADARPSRNGREPGQVTTWSRRLRIRI